MPSHGFDWEKNPETVARLKALWLDGKTSTEIVKILGNGLTRNAVIGKVHRLDLPPRPSSPRSTQKLIPKEPPVMTKPKPKTPPPPPPECPKPTCPPETIPDGRVCKHIEGDPSKPGWQVCGNPVKAEKPYCEYHYSRCVDLVRTAQIRKHKL